MKIRLALLAVPFLALACNDAEQATLLEPPAIAADVTTEGLVTQCIQVTFTCAKNVTSGWVYYRLTPNGVDESFNCVDGGGRRIHNLGPQNGITVEFDILGAPASCEIFTYHHPLPVRTKCTVNGRDVGGKGLGKLVAKYVKGEC